MAEFGGGEYLVLNVLLHVCKHLRETSYSLSLPVNKKDKKNTHTHTKIIKKERKKNDRIRTNFIYTVFGGNSAILRRTTRIRMGMMLFYIKFYLYYFRENFFLSLSCCFCFIFSYFFVFFLFSSPNGGAAMAKKKPGTFSVCACAFWYFCALVFPLDAMTLRDSRFDFNQHQSCS